MSTTFNFSQFKMDLSVSDKAEVEKSGSGERKPRNLPAGLHEVVIKEVTAKGVSQADETWEKLTIKFEASNMNYCYHLLMIPTVGLKFGPKGDLWAWKKLKSFIEAIGFEITDDNIPDLLSKLFSSPERMVGLKLNIELKYTSHHGLYLEKNKIALVDKDGEQVVDGDNDPVIEADYAAVENAANELGLKYDGRPSLIAYGVPLKNDLSKFEKKVKKLARPVDDAPF